MEQCSEKTKIQLQQIKTCMKNDKFIPLIYSKFFLTCYYSGVTVLVWRERIFFNKIEIFSSLADIFCLLKLIIFSSRKKKKSIQQIIRTCSANWIGKSLGSLREWSKIEIKTPMDNPHKPNRTLARLIDFPATLSPSLYEVCLCWFLLSYVFTKSTAITSITTLMKSQQDPYMKVGNTLIIFIFCCTKYSSVGTNGISLIDWWIQITRWGTHPARRLVPSTNLLINSWSWLNTKSKWVT